MYEVRRINILSAAKVSVIAHVTLYLALGSGVMALYFFIQGFSQGSFLASTVSAMTLFLLWLTGTIAVMLYAWIMGAVVAAFYNLFAGWWGGLKAELVTDARLAPREVHDPKPEAHEALKAKESKSGKSEVPARIDFVEAKSGRRSPKSDLRGAKDKEKPSESVHP